MTAQTIIILVLSYGVGGALCLMIGLIIGAASRRPDECERHEMDSDQPPVKTTVHWKDKRDDF